MSGVSSATQSSESQSSERDSDATTFILRPFLNHGRGDVAMSRVVQQLLANEEVRTARANGILSQLDRMERTLNKVATREPPVREVIIREIERPPPVPAKDEPSPPPSSSPSASTPPSSAPSSSTAVPIKRIPRKPPPSLPSSESEAEPEPAPEPEPQPKTEPEPEPAPEDTRTEADTGMADVETLSVHSDSSEETAMPTTPQMANLNLDITSRLDHMDNLFSRVLGQQQMLLDELDRRDPTRFEELLVRVLTNHLEDNTRSSPTSTLRSLWPEGGSYPGAGSTSSKDEANAPPPNTVASLSSSSQSSEFQYNPSVDSAFRDLPSAPGSEVTPPWVPPPMELPEGMVNGLRRKEQPKQRQGRQPQQTVVYYPQAQAVPGEYPRQPSPQESVPEPFRDAESSDGHGDHEIRPTPFVPAQEEPAPQMNAPTLGLEEERHYGFRGPTPQEDLNLPTPHYDRRFKQRDLPQTTTAPIQHHAAPPHVDAPPASAPPPAQVPLTTMHNEPPRAQTMPPPGPIPLRGPSGFGPYLPTPGPRFPHRQYTPLRPPARTPMTTTWRSRDLGPHWYRPVPRGMMYPGMRPGMYPMMPRHSRPWGPMEPLSELHSTDRSSLASTESSMSSKSSKGSATSEKTIVGTPWQQSQSGLAETEKEHVEVTDEGTIVSDDFDLRELAMREVEMAADERKRIEEESRARDEEIERLFEEKIQEELKKVEESHREAQAKSAQMAPVPLPPSPSPQPASSVTHEAPVIHIDMESQRSHRSRQARSRRSYPLSRYTSSVSSTSPSSASEDVLVTPGTNNAQVSSLMWHDKADPKLNDWLHQQAKSGMSPSEERLSNFMTGVSDQINGLSVHLKRELEDIILCIDDLRHMNRPKRVQAGILPDGTVQLSTGEIVDGIRGEIKPGAVQFTSASPHVQGRVLPDGTIKAGDSELENLRGKRREPETEAEVEEIEQRKKNEDQEECLSMLEGRRKFMTKISSLQQCVRLSAKSPTVRTLRAKLGAANAVIRVTTAATVTPVTLETARSLRRPRRIRSGSSRRLTSRRRKMWRSCRALRLCQLRRLRSPAARWRRNRASLRRHTR